MKPQISVIIPTYNEAQYIVPCLASLQGQALKPKEVIVVDDGSTDNTLKIVHSTSLRTILSVNRRIVNSLKIENCKLKIVSQAHRGAGAARNLGAKHATGDILVFLDADMEFDEDFLKNLVTPIVTGKTQGTFSKNEFVKNWDNPWAKAWSYCLGLKDNRLVPADYPDTAPVFRAILKSEFDRVGGFDPTRGYDDDWSLSEKLGYPATVAPSAIYYHHNPDSLMEIFRQARWRASRKYKLGLAGKLIAYLKVKLIIFRPPFDPITIISKLAFITGTHIGLIFPRLHK